MNEPKKWTDCQTCGEGMDLLKADTAFFVTEPRLINCSLYFCSSADCKEMGRAIVVPWETLRTEEELDEMQPSEERIRQAATEAAEDQNKMVEEARKITNNE